MSASEVTMDGTLKWLTNGKQTNILFVGNTGQKNELLGQILNGNVNSFAEQNHWTNRMFSSWRGVTKVNLIHLDGDVRRLYRI